MLRAIGLDPKKYLPRVYQDDAGSASFLERMLANMEGIYTELDGKIERVFEKVKPDGHDREVLDYLRGTHP